MTLRKGQKELVENYRGGFCAVPAIPGGGKTYSLSYWAAEIISKGLHKPGKILIVTYMNSAVNNFKQRISRLLAERGISSGSDYFVSTIHGLCLQIIMEKPDAVLADDEFRIIDEARRYELLDQSIEQWKKENKGLMEYFVDGEHLKGKKSGNILDMWQNTFCKVISAAIGDFKTRGISPSEAEKRCKDLPQSSILRCAARIYSIYDRNLKTGGFLDFDDMLYNARKLLKDDRELLEKYRRRYTYVCEDEAQDSNLIQSEILTMIANGNFLRVGDSNQAICGTFTNSDPSLFRNFCEHPETTVYNITQSGRSTRQIINLANHLVEYVCTRHPVPQCRESLIPQYIEPAGAGNPSLDEYGVKTGVFRSWEDEAQGVVSAAARFLQSFPGKTVAILIPDSWRINYVVSILEARNIPFYELSNDAGERTRAVRLLGRILDYAAVPHSAEKLASLFNEYFSEQRKKSPAQFELLCKFLENCPPEELLYPEKDESGDCKVPEGLINTNIWDNFTETLGRIRDIIEFPTYPPERFILFAAEKFGFGREETAIAQKVATEAGYMSREQGWSLGSFAQKVLLANRNVFSHFCSAVWELNGYEPEPGVVTVSTYHKAKGLEWDCVFLTGLNHDTFPVKLSDKFKGEYWYLKQEYRNPQALVKADMKSVADGLSSGDLILESKLETISEKARLLYVGITRAKERLFMSAVRANAGRKNEILPSEYFLELRKYIEEQEKVYGQAEA